MKKISVPLCILVIVFILTACSTGKSETIERENPDGVELSNETIQKRGEADMSTPLAIELKIDDEVFSAKLYDNQTTQALVELLPLNVDMEDLHRNEKFYYLSDRLPTNSESPGEIRAGDIMLYGDNCLVIFYKNLSTSHNYTRLGHIEDMERFAQVIGDGDITVTLDIARNDK